MYKTLQNNQAKPRSYTREEKKIVAKDYCVSYKLDGEHRFLICENGAIPYLIDVNDNQTPFSTEVWNREKVIIEGELYEGELYAFDVLLKDIPFRKRFDTLSKLIMEIKGMNIKLKEFLFTKKEGMIFTHCKKILRSTNLRIDGLIFTPQNKLYYDSTAFVYKWKPAHLLTIDFLIQDSKIYTAISKHQFLNLKMNRLPQFKGIRVDNYFKLLFCKEFLFKESLSKEIKDDIHILRTDTPDIYENKIVECLYDGERFIPIKIRDDKTESYLKNTHFSGPNNYNTCLSILEESLNPISEEELFLF